MTARLTFVFMVVLAGLLGSCQQPFADNEAKAVINGPLPATLKAPSLSLSDAQYDSSVTVSSSVELGDTAAIAAMLVWAQGLVGGSLTTTQTGTPFAITATGLPHYRAVGNNGYTITGGNRSLIYKSSSAGTAVEAIQDYEELSDDYYANDGAVRKIFKAGAHSLYRDEYDYDIAYNDGTLSAVGTFATKIRGEWFQDPNGTGAGGGATFGVVEASAGLLLGVTYTSGGVTLAGKILMTAVQSQSYTSNTNASAGHSVTLTYTIQCYDTQGQFLDSVQATGVTANAPSAYY